MKNKKIDKPYFHNSVSFRVKNAPHLHDVITKITKIKPSESHRKGDIRNQKLGKKWSNDIWIITSPLNEKSSMSKHLQWIHRRLKPHMSYFLKLKKSGVEMDLFCGYISDCDHAGFSIEPEALEVAHRLRLKLEVSVILG